MDRHLIDYLPPIVGDTVEFKELCKTEETEISNLWDGTARVLDEQYLETMSEYGVGRTEKMLGITPFDTDTLADRKFRIKAWSNSDLPYTIRALERMLSALCGEDYTLTLTGYEMTVKMGLGVHKQYNEVEKLLERVVPANIKITVELLYNTHEMLSEYTHAQLAAYTHGELRTEVFNANNS